ncbi:MAG: carboxypeptidase regulatory-like domain-containing protein [Gemmatimonadota bacterium]
MILETSRRVALLLVCAGALLAGEASLGTAQQGVTTGAIQGRVTDSDGGPAGGAPVVVRNVETGAQRLVETDEEGRYAAGFLQTGIYVVSTEFVATAESAPIRVNVGETVTVNLSLAPLEAEAVVTEVEGEGEVDIAQGGVADRVNEQQIENLPAVGRDFTDFIQLSGLVSLQPEVGTGGQFSIAGARTSSTNVQVDGAGANNVFFGENRGSSRLPFAVSLESIKEFQVVTNGFDVEYGNYNGGVVNAITKNGTNELRGSGFFFYRNEGFTANNVDDTEPTDFTVSQFGGFASGPLVRDRLHFFVSLDGQQKEQPVPALTAEASGFPADSIERLVQILENVYGFEAADEQVGLFEETDDETALFARLDWQANDRHRVTIRNNYTDFENTNDRISPEEALTHGARFEDKSNSLVGELNSSLSDDLFNVFRFQWATEDRPRPGNNLLPEFDVNLTSSDRAEFFGDGIVFRNNLEEDTFQVIDNLTWTSGAHTLKVGTNNSFININNLFHLLGNGEYRFRSLADLEARRPDSYFRLLREGVGEEISPRAEYGVSELAFYGQDEWRVNDHLLLNLGLRWDTAVFNDEAAGFPGLSDSLSAPGRAIDVTAVPEDRDNFGPRASLTYDVSADGRSIVRAGVGRFFGRAPYVLHGNVLQTSPPLLSVFCSARDGTVPEPDVEFFAQDPTGGNNPTVCVGGAAAGGRPQFTVWDEDFQNPESWKLNLGYEQAVGARTTFALDGIYSTSSDLYNAFDVNLRDPVFTLASEGGRPVHVPADRFNPSSNASSDRLRNRAFDRVFFNTNEAEARSVSGIVRVNHRFSDRLRGEASYTYTRARDNSSSSCCTSQEFFESPTAGDPNFIGDPGDEERGAWGPSEFERPHVIVVNGSYDLPAGFQVSAIYRGQDGNPWTPIVDGDINGDGLGDNDRAFVSTDLQFETPEDAGVLSGLIEEFDCLQDNVGRITERNSCRNPWWHRLDMRLQWGTETLSGQRIVFLFDVFNVLNDDFVGVFGGNTELLNAEDFDEATGRVVYSVNSDFGTEQALGFEPFQRQAQLGVRYVF